jgi:tRNA pseudouridine32 synthase/23S rRNA pseudouridine746 synthase
VNRPRFRLPPLDGHLSCRKVLTEPFDGSLIDAMCAHYPEVRREELQQRFEHRHVFGADGHPLAPELPFRAPFEVHYYRPFVEAPIPVQESILYEDDCLIAADKPHFLPVHPAGKYLRETLVERLRQRLGCADLSPLHRLDRATAGVVLFVRNPATRGSYQNLFRDRLVEKRYEALAPPMPGRVFPLEYASRLERHADGFRSQEVAGEPNAHTRIEVIECGPGLWRYALYPRSGQMHQLRAQMSALGAPIVNDDWYPTAQPSGRDDYSRPLQLLAQRISFVDPLTGELREFCSQLSLAGVESVSDL